MSALAIAIQALMDDASVTALVADRVHAVELPETFIRPAIVVTLVAESEDQMTAGASGWFQARVSCACLADDAGGANALGEAVKGALGNLTNHHLSDGESPETITAVATVWKGSTDRTDVSQDRRVFRRILDFHVRYRVPS